MKRLLASIIIWGVCYIASTAQTIHGVVMNKAGEPIQFVNIVELSRADSSFIGGTVSKDDGKFTLNSVKDDNILRFSCMGYKTTYVNYFGQDSINITLHENASMLGEVIVKSHLPQTRLNGEGMSTIVAGSVLEKTANMEQLLSRIPAVSAKDGQIEVLTPAVQTCFHVFSDSLTTYKIIFSAFSLFY